MKKAFTLAAMMAFGITFFASAAIPSTSYTLSADGKTIEKWTGTESEISLADDEVLKNVEAIGAYAFQNSAVESIIFNEGLTSIGRGAFMDCNNLTSATFPSTLTNLGNAAFSTCTALQSITLPNALAAIGTSCFYNCESLSSVNLEHTSVTELPDGVFNSCKNLSAVNLGDKITSIGEETFYMCNSLASVVLPAPLTTIGASAFSGCVTLKEITFNPTLSEIGNYAFEATAIETLDLRGLTELTSIGFNAFSECDEMTTLHLPLQEPWFGNKAFNRCSALKEVVIPDTYSQISTQMFYYCTGLEKVTLGEATATIKNGAFFDCTSLKEIIWNEKLETIEWNVFFECNSLETVDVPESVTSLDDHAFNSCAKLASVTLGSNISTIGQEAFSMLPSLKHMTVKAVTPPVLGSYAFYKTDVANCTLTVPSESIEAYKAAGQWNEFGTIAQVSSIETIGSATATPYSITTNASGIKISGLPGGESIAIYTPDGRIIHRHASTGEESYINLPAGLYLVTINGSTHKVAVR